MSLREKTPLGSQNKGGISFFNNCLLIQRKVQLEFTVRNEMLLLEIGTDHRSSYECCLLISYSKLSIFYFDDKEYTFIEYNTIYHPSKELTQIKGKSWLLIGKLHP